MLQGIRVPSDSKVKSVLSFSTRRRLVLTSNWEATPYPLFSTRVFVVGLPGETLTWKLYEGFWEISHNRGRDGSSLGPEGILRT